MLGLFTVSEVYFCIFSKRVIGRKLKGRFLTKTIETTNSGWKSCLKVCLKKKSVSHILKFSYQVNVHIPSEHFKALF